MPAEIQAVVDMVAIPFEKLATLSLRDVIGKTDLGYTSLASPTEVSALKGDPGEGAIRGTIRDWRLIAIHIVGQPTAIVVLGARDSQYWGTSPVVVLDEHRSRVRTRSGSLYLLEQPGEGEPPLEHVLHLCNILWAWGGGHVLEVPEVFYG